MTKELIGQIFSIIGMALTLVSFQMKTKKQILMVQTAGSSFFLASYLLFGSWAAVCLNVVFLIRNTVFYFKTQKWASHRIWLYILLVLVIVAGALGFKTYWDIFTIIGAIFGTVAASMKSENMFRLLKLGDSPCWLIYNASIPSIGGIICEIINIASILIGLIRYKKDGFAKNERRL